MQTEISTKAKAQSAKSLVLASHVVPDQDKIRLQNIKALFEVSKMYEPPITFNPKFAIWSCKNLLEQMQPGNDKRAATRIIATMMRNLN